MMEQHVIREETWTKVNEFFLKYPEMQKKMTWLQEQMKKQVREKVLESQEKTLLEGHAKGRAEGEYKAKQSALIRQLRLKFEIVPDEVVKTIQTTFENERLDNWLDQVILAKTFEDIKF